jgi:uncharacterized cupin superfamily protein
VSHPNLVHWDDVPADRHSVGDIAGAWADLGAAAGTIGVGLQRIRIEPGRRSTPVHVHRAEEEIFYVLGGSGLLWQDGETCAVAEGDCIVHRRGAEAHTLRAGEAGLEVLAFGERLPGEAAYLPRAGMLRMGRATVEGGHEEHPWAREAAAGELAFPDPGPRFRNVAAVTEVEPKEAGSGSVARVRRDVAAAAGRVRTGLNHVEIPAGKRAYPLHCHSAEEEVFVVLAGEGTLELGAAEPVDEHPVRAGHVLARPPGTGVAHCFRAGPDGLTLLAYGTREPNDIAYYPRSNKVSLRGVGVIARLERLDYMDGEP